MLYDKEMPSLRDKIIEKAKVVEEEPPKKSSKKLKGVKKVEPIKRKKDK